MSKRPSMQQQQFDTMRKANSNASNFACGVFALAVSFTQKSIIVSSKFCELPLQLVDVIVAIALHIGNESSVRKTIIFNNFNSVSRLKITFDQWRMNDFTNACIQSISSMQSLLYQSKINVYNNFNLMRYFSVCKQKEENWFHFLNEANASTHSESLKQLKCETRNTRNNEKLSFSFLPYY